MSTPIPEGEQLTESTVVVTMDYVMFREPIRVSAGRVTKSISVTNVFCDSPTPIQITLPVLDGKDVIITVANKNAGLVTVIPSPDDVGALINDSASTTIEEGYSVDYQDVAEENEWRIISGGSISSGLIYNTYMPGGYW